MPAPTTGHLYTERELDLVEWEVGELDLIRENDDIVAIVAVRRAWLQLICGTLSQKSTTTTLEPQNGANYAQESQPSEAESAPASAANLFHQMMTYQEEHLIRRFCILALTLVGMALRVMPAAAATITINCNEKMTISKALGLLNPMESNTIRVTGVCREGNTIQGFSQLSIVGITTKSSPATIEVPSSLTGFWIVGSHVQLSNLKIDGGLFGAVCVDFSVCNFSRNTFENATSVGVWLDNADGTFNGDVIKDNLNSGLTLSAARARLTQLTVTGSISGPNNQGYGIDVQANSTITADGLTVTGNQGAGIYLVGNAHLINQFWIGPLVVSGNTNGGIWVTENSSADLSSATVINNSGAAGVVITGNSEAAFWGGGTFTGNTAGDVYCGPLNGVAASPQSATIGVTNCPSTYQ